MSAQEQDFAVGAGRLGHVARGIVFGIMGLFLMLAAFRQEPARPRAWLARSTYSPNSHTGRSCWVSSRRAWCYMACTCSSSRYRRMVLG